MSKADTARIAYQAARQETVMRIRLRDNMLLVFLATVSAIFGIALKTGAQKHIVLIIPFLTLGVTFIITYHNYLIGALHRFCENEVAPFLRNAGVDGDDENAPQWDTSDAQENYFNVGEWLKTFGYFFILTIPSLLSLLLWRKQAVAPESPIVFVWIGAIICFLLTVAVICFGYYLRKHHYREGQP